MRRVQAHWTIYYIWDAEVGGLPVAIGSLATETVGQRFI